LFSTTLNRIFEERRGEERSEEERRGEKKVLIRDLGSRDEDGKWVQGLSEFDTW
jgi:hypothetical protein